MVIVEKAKHVNGRETVIDMDSYTDGPLFTVVCYVPGGVAVRSKTFRSERGAMKAARRWREGWSL